MGAWMGFIVTSSWALLWVAGPLVPGRTHAPLCRHFCCSLVLFALLRRADAAAMARAYTVFMSAASSLPRFSLVLVAGGAWGCCNTLFLGFFAMLALMLGLRFLTARTAVARHWCGCCGGAGGVC